MRVDPDTHPVVGHAPDGTVLTSAPQDTAVDRATAAARRVVDALLRTDRGNANLERVAEELDNIAEHLEEHAPEVRERLIDMWHGRVSPGTIRHRAGERARSAAGARRSRRRIGGRRRRTDLPVPGPPGHVHGGVSALLLDHTLGVANAWAGRSGATAQLNVRYHRPTPLFEPLTITGRLVEQDGRKINTVGEIRTADGTVCVSVEALFIDRTVPRPR